MDSSANMDTCQEINSSACWGVGVWGTVTVVVVMDVGARHTGFSLSFDMFGCKYSALSLLVSQHLYADSDGDALHLPDN